MASTTPPLRTEKVLIDSRARDTSVFPSASSYQIDLPVPVTRVKKVELASIQIPNTAYNVETPNNSFIVYKGTEEDPTMYDPSKGTIVSVNPGMHTIDSLVEAFNTAIAAEQLQDFASMFYSRVENRLGVGSLLSSTLIFGSIQPQWRLSITAYEKRTMAFSIGTQRSSSVEINFTPLSVLRSDPTAVVHGLNEWGETTARTINTTLHTAGALAEAYHVVLQEVSPPDAHGPARISFLIKTVPLNTQHPLQPPVVVSTGTRPISRIEFSLTLEKEGLHLDNVCTLGRRIGTQRVLHGTPRGTRTKFDGIPDLTTERYVLLRCPELGNIQQIDNNAAKSGTSYKAFSDLFAVVPLPGAAGTLVFQDSQSSNSGGIGHRWFDGLGLSNLSRLTFNFVYYDGTEVDFRGLDHSMLLKITHME